jgi:F-type H+-transporting ATPase subunit b
MIEVDKTLLIQIVNFLVLMFVLNIILYKPIMKIMDSRQKRIDDANEEVRELDETVQGKVADYEERLRRARAEAMEQREAIKNEGTEKATEIIGQARAEVGEMIQGFKTKVAAEKEEARQVLHRQTRRIALEISEKVLGRSVQ